MGTLLFTGEIKNKGYAFFLGGDGGALKVYYGRFSNGEWCIWECVDVIIVALVYGVMQLLIPTIISTVVPAGILQPPFFYANDIPR